MIGGTSDMMFSPGRQEVLYNIFYFWQPLVGASSSTQLDVTGIWLVRIRSTHLYPSVHFREGDEWHLQTYLATKNVQGQAYSWVLRTFSVAKQNY